MKKIITLLSLFSSLLTQGQIILNKTESTAKTVQDPNAVILSPGFYVNSAIANPFIAKIGASTEIPPANPSNSVAGSSNPSGTTLDSSNFHDTKGNIDVAPSGQLQYTLPIALPPGIKTVAPQINLTYTSGGGNGIAGYGWNIAGITSISRMSKSIEKDGEIKGVQLDYSDYYGFNGQRLLLKSGEYGKSGAEYVTEKFSNTKIKSIGAITGQSYQGPEYWEVTFEDGSQAYYGSVANARTPSDYNIVKWKDAQGNYITYNYIQTDNVAIIKSIQWGGNENLLKPHFNEIVFNYAGRNTKEIAYSNGVLFIQLNILDYVQVNANGSQFKKYAITYKKDINNTNYQFVDKITEYNSTNQPANPVVFEYEKSTNSTWKTQSFTDNDNNKVVGDFDGDGNLDYLKYYESYTECTAYEDQEIIVTDQDGYDSYSYWSQVCVASVQKPAGINFFHSFFDNQNIKTSVTSTLPFTKDQFDKAIAISFVDNNNQVSQKQGILIRKEIPIANSKKKDILLEVYAIDNNLLQLKLSKTLPAEKYDNSDRIAFEDDFGIEYYSSDIVTKITGAKELDLDGNGISEIILLAQETTTTRSWNPNSDTGFYRTEIIGSGGSYETQIDVRNFSVIAEMHSIIPLDKSFSIVPLNGEFESETGLGDFNGDSKIDIIKYNSTSSPSLIEFYKDKTTLTFKYTEKNFYQGQSQTIKGLKSKALKGDFNGDGKTDLFIPLAEKSKDWYLYISKGNSFIEYEYKNFSYYNPSNNFEDGGRFYIYNRQYIAQDLNQDGKSDFIEFSSHSRQNREKSNNFSEFIINAFENKGFDSVSGKYLLEKKNIDGHTEIKVGSFPTESYRSYPFSYSDGQNLYVNKHASFASVGTPFKIEPFSIMIGDFNINNTDNQILVIKKGKIFSFTYGKVVSRANTIVQGGITTNILYDVLDPAKSQNLYTIEKKENFPYIELEKLPKFYVVSQLRQVGRKQDFKYSGFVSHLQGKGFLGFRKTARTSWYAENFENTKVWGAFEIDPFNENVPVKEWSTRDENNIFPNNVNENTAGLISFKKIDYDVKKLTTGVDVITPINVLQKDFLSNVVTSTTTSYDNYFLPTKLVVTTNGSINKTTNITYLHNESGQGNNYYIGKVRQKEDIATAYGDTKKTKDEFTYENNLLKTSKTYNNDYSEYVMSTFTYDAFGNVVEKETTNSVDTQKQFIKSVYDDKGRFVVKSFDNLGLETQFSYNDWGQTTSQKDPLGNTITNTYDAWGKLLEAYNNFTGYTKYQYKRSDFNAIITKYLSDGNTEMTISNPKGETYLVRTKAFNNGDYIDKEIKYDILGRKIAESEPYISGYENPKWNQISYDDSTFPGKATATSFTGKIAETRIEGRTTIVQENNGYNRITKKTTDALGNIVESEDKGGVITFTYNAVGQNLTTSYGQNTVCITYDSWGRKATFNDPSNGFYKYEYNGFGQIKKEISPKGYKEYTYNNLGQIITQIEKSTDGTTTDKTISFSYDNLGRITNKQGACNGKTYSSYITYDAQGRIIASGENANDRYFMQKNILYDDKGRIVSYERGLYSGGTNTKVYIENVYNTWNGALQQVKDKNTQKILWQLEESKANGQVVKAKLGALTVNNLYDANDFLTSVKQSYIPQGQSTPVNVLDLAYQFDAIKNELKKRTRAGSFINLTENFAYDDNNRLVNWTNPKTGQLSNNVYDEKGRIIENDQLGKSTFPSTGKIYQCTTLELNSNGQQNWPDDASIIQKITYNENNDPVFIDGKNGDYAFEYGCTEMRQVMHYGGNFAADNAAQTAKFTKYYSEDGSYEVIRDNTTGQEKHILYIGGTPYESNIVYLKDFASQQAKPTFLHKDYLGSILAITDIDGAILEQRHFDAWGILTHGEMKVLDRGYTSHEHLQDVGLIHMNGRLYDPLLRRFLNADENIQDPYNTQCYNKYGYVINNPLMFNDPSGEFFPLLFISAALMKAIIIGAAVGLASYTLGLAVTGNLWRWSLGGALKATFWGAVSGAVTFGIGSMFSVAKEGVQTATNFAKSLGGLKSAGTIFVQASCHAVAQGALSLMQGGDFLSGAAGGFFGSLGASAWGAAAGKFASSTVGTIGFGALSGGIGAELTGGNFFQGAVTGGIVAGLNHVMHTMDEGGLLVKKDSEIIILDDSDAVAGAGHMAMLAGNDKKGWTYVASGGRVDTDGNTIIGGDSVPILENKTSTPELATKKSALKYLSRFDLKISIKTTYNLAMKAVNAAYNSANGYYHVLFHNCGHVVGEGLEAINIYGGGRFTVSPNMRFMEILNRSTLIR